MQKHLRNTFLAGIFAAIPIAVTAFIIWWIEVRTRPISAFLFHGREIPFVGVAIALAAIYIAGLIATSLLGKFLLGIIDRLLNHLPVIKHLYLAWKQIALTPGGTEGVFSKVALIPDEAGLTLLLGFTSGRALEGQPDLLCVFVPAAPNPVNGRLYFVRRDACRVLEMSTEDAFKIILSTGNYLPTQIGISAGELLGVSGNSIARATMQTASTR